MGKIFETPRISKTFPRFALLDNSLHEEPARLLKDMLLNTPQQFDVELGFGGVHISDFCVSTVDCYDGVLLLKSSALRPKLN